MHIKSLRHQIDQLQQAFDLKSQDHLKGQSEAIQSLQMKQDHQERTVRKLGKEIEVS